MEVGPSALEGLVNNMNRDGLVDANFWRGRRVLVTGHTGFKGSWLSHWLIEMGADVTGYALEPNTNPSIFSTIDLKPKMRHVIGDIRDLLHLSEVVRLANPEVVFHMAAQPLVLKGYKNPRNTFEVNVMGTVNLLEICREQKKLKTFINITTDKVYENRERERGYEENDSLGGHDPYSSSKACSELVTSSMRRSYFDEKEVSVITCRAGNVFGGGDWCDNRLIPDAIRAFSKNNALIVRNPESVRPWQHVLEPLRAYLLLAEKSFCFDTNFPKTFNIGPTEKDAVPVRDLIRDVCKFWGDEARWQTINETSTPHEAKFLKLDCRLAQTKINWLPLFELKTGLRMTVDWYKDFYKNSASNSGSLKRIMNEQIRLCLRGEV